MSVKAVSGVKPGNRVFEHTTPTPSAREAAEAIGIKIDTVVRVSFSIRSFLRNHRMFVRGFVEDHKKLVGWDSDNLKIPPSGSVSVGSICSLRAGPLSVLLAIHPVNHSIFYS